VPYLESRGIVADEEDDRGDVVILVRGERVTINRKRLVHTGKREDLYPNGYDLDIVLLSKGTVNWRTRCRGNTRA